MVRSSDDTDDSGGQQLSDTAHLNASSSQVESHNQSISTRPITISSSSATLCQLDDGEEKDKIVDHPPPILENNAASTITPATNSNKGDSGIIRGHSLTHAHQHQHRHHRPTDAQSAGRARRHTITTPSERAPPPPVPDIISFFDPASAGGGGPLERIETARSEREREREEREARTGVIDGGGGILKRFRTTSGTTKRRPTFIKPILPPHPHGPDDDEEEEEEEFEARHVRHGLTNEDSLGTTLTQEINEKDHEYTDSTKDREGQTEEAADDELHVYPDGGYGWVVLVCCATLAGCTMGWGMNYGVFQQYYAENVFRGANTSVLSLGGTLCAFAMNSTAFLSGRYGDRYGFKRALYLGVSIAWLGLFLASWSTKLWQIILTQGLITGIGQGITMPLFMSLPSQWFYKRRGLASGIAIGGAGIGGGTSSLVVRQLLTAVGYKKTLLIMSFVNLFFCLLSILLIRTRPTSPEARSAGKGPWIDMSVVGTSAFWSLVSGMFVAVIGYAMPFNFLSQWAQINLPELPTLLIALPVTLLGFTVCIGRALVGFVADKLGPMNTFVLCFFLSGVIQLALWLTANSLAAICVFGVMFGLVAPGYVGILPQNVVQLFGRANLATNVGLLLLANGPGNLISGPLGGALFDSSGGKNFDKVIIMSGCFQIGGALIICWARYKACDKVFAKI
ncbi:hypothetical protein CI109_107266 [Kwoniella shandongensis]|uniref:Uncharacterized protein n=1 Tax=Kwoniella shandongensis TaxID=1734106 RepID=A0A5M6C264_9TREE|nr:uncharacterized protein CI109_002548 [Kwoniella shandongensis]KAA5529207.1 hypothetical protein CI109_002548 [Kwoniella shandongensis]